jgi:hypothetical protein
MAPTRGTAIVVLGAPRSGTTLLATAIGAHPLIALLFEDPYGSMFRVLGGKLPAVKLCTPNQIEIDRRWRAIYGSIEWNGWLRKHVAYLLPRSRLSLRDMAKLAEIKAVCLVRDPGGNIDALRRRENKPVGISRYLLRRTYSIYEQLAAEPGIDARIVSFDRFVREPEGQLRRLCLWLDLPFDARMLDAPRLNPLYPEETFRGDKSAMASDGRAAKPEDAYLAGLRTRYEALLARAL